jgi:aspartate 1-decarboxylase
VIEALGGSGMIGLNGAAARLAMTGDKVIIVAYASCEEVEARAFRPRVVLVDEENRIRPG